MAAHMLGAPELVKGVEFMAKAVGTVSASMPRGYLIPADLEFIADKLRTHNVKVEVLAKPIKVSGEEYVIDKIGQGQGDGYSMIKLDGGFAKSPVKEFPAGTFHVDMAQPMANVAFYMLEPQAADGFVGSGVFSTVFTSLGADKRSIVYPVYKYFKVLN
jgi:dipeptidyl-peptidase-4